MADIAFLLLIFFLVTAVIPNDKGISRKLAAPCPPDMNCGAEILKKNILEVKVNLNDELFVGNKLITIEDLKDITKTFLDNNADESCNYCHGVKDKNSSDNPQKAVISLSNDLQTSYNFYIKVQDELTKAYYELRKEYSENVLKKSTDQLTKEDLKQVQKAYPFLLSEAEIKNQ